MKKRDREDSGFTLVEMAVVVIIVGIVVASIVPRMFTKIQKDKIKEGKQIVRAARDEILGLAIMNATDVDAQMRYLPLNSTNAAGEYTAPEDVVHRLDPWGNELLYYVAYNATDATLANENSTICKFSNSTNATTMGVVTFNGKHQDNVAFIVVSKGPNFHEDLTFNSTTFKKVGKDGYSEYADDGSVPVDATLEFDDIVEFVTLDYLKEKMGCQ
jgi:prepilin-type N-terminal cleavage/methylation domain-containing protein